MRIVYGNTMERRWYGESGAVGWGLMLEVVHYGSPSVENDDDIMPEGWEVLIQVGPWYVSILSESAAEIVHGDSLKHMGRLERI